MEIEALPGVLPDTGANTPEREPPEGSRGALEAMRRTEAISLDPFGLVTEAEAYRIYRHLLEDKELRRARAAGRIGYLRRKRTIHYRREELDAFVRALVERSYVQPCPTYPQLASTMPATTPMAPPPMSAPGTAAISEELLRQAAERLRRVPFGTRCGASGRTRPGR